MNHVFTSVTYRDILNLILQLADLDTFNRIAQLNKYCREYTQPLIADKEAEYTVRIEKHSGDVQSLLMLSTPVKHGWNVFTKCTGSQYHELYHKGRLVEQYKLCIGYKRYRTYLDGRIHGVVMLFTEDDTLVSLTEYRLGRPWGISMWFDDDMFSISECYGGRLHGLTIRCTYDGQIISCCEYVHSRLNLVHITNENTAD